MPACFVFRTYMSVYAVLRPVVEKRSAVEAELLAPGQVDNCLDVVHLRCCRTSCIAQIPRRSSSEDQLTKMLFQAWPFRARSRNLTPKAVDTNGRHGICSGHRPHRPLFRVAGAGRFMARSIAKLFVRLAVGDVPVRRQTAPGLRSIGNGRRTCTILGTYQQPICAVYFLKQGLARGERSVSDKRLVARIIYSPIIARAPELCSRTATRKEKTNMTTYLLHFAKQLPCLVVILTTFVMVMSKNADKEGFVHWTARASHDTRRGLGDLLQSAGSDVAKSLFTSARIGTSRMCGTMAGRDEMCISFRAYACIAFFIISFLLVSLAFCIAAAFMARPPRYVSGADVFFRRIGLAFVVVGFAFAMGTHEIGAQLQRALGGQSKTGVAWVGALVTLVFSILGLAADAYFSYRNRRLPTPQEDETRFADSAT